MVPEKVPDTIRNSLNLDRYRSADLTVTRMRKADLRWVDLHCAVDEIFLKL